MVDTNNTNSLNENAIKNFQNQLNSLLISRFIYATDNAKNKIVLKSSIFTGSINILYIEQGIFDVNINNINIQTPQRIIHTKTNGFNPKYVNTIHIDKDSILNLNNIKYKPLLLFLNGANYQFLYNLRGTIIINNFKTIENNINDIWNLKPSPQHIIHTKSSFKLFINHSYIIGCTHPGFQLYYGSISISNSIISYLPILMQSIYTIDSINLYSTNVSNINNQIYISSHDIEITQFIFSSIAAKLNMFSSNVFFE